MNVMIVTIMTTSDVKWYGFLGFCVFLSDNLFDKFEFIQVDALILNRARIHWIELSTRASFYCRS